MARDCRIACELVPGVGYVLTGSCVGAGGEPLDRVTFGVSVVLSPGDVPATACRVFRAEVLRVFGAGGARRLVEGEQIGSPMGQEPYDGSLGFGRLPRSRVEGAGGGL